MPSDIDFRELELLGGPIPATVRQQLQLAVNVGKWLGPGDTINLQNTEAKFFDSNGAEIVDVVTITAINEALITATVDLTNPAIQRDAEYYVFFTATLGDNTKARAGYLRIGTFPI
jgi:hypothetical protein